MDSMRSLNTSLPRARRNPRPAPSELIQAFKSAALSVTQLYKSAAAEHDNSRAAGYQDALDDLLAFLDDEQMGLGDGEGWRVRQWATERLSPAAYGSDAEMDHEEDRSQRTASQPPLSVSNTSNTATADRHTRTESQLDQRNGRTSSEPPTQDHSAPTFASSPPSNAPSELASSVFHFRAQAPTTTTSTENTSIPASEPSIFGPTSSIRLEVHPRHTHPRQTRLGGSRLTREQTPGATEASSSQSAGSKRKHTFNDFFDFSDLSNFKDGFGGGGGKRTRFL